MNQETKLNPKLKALYDRVMQFGKYKGQKFSQVPNQYFGWCIDNIDRCDVFIQILYNYRKTGIFDEAKYDSVAKYIKDSGKPIEKKVNNVQNVKKTHYLADENNRRALGRKKKSEERRANRDYVEKPLISCGKCSKNHPYMLYLSNPGVKACCAYCNAYIKFLPFNQIRSHKDTMEIILDTCMEDEYFLSAVEQSMNKIPKNIDKFEKDVLIHNFYVMLALLISNNDQRIFGNNRSYPDNSMFG